MRGSDDPEVNTTSTVARHHRRVLTTETKWLGRAHLLVVGQPGFDDAAPSGNAHLADGRRLNSVEYERITINPAQMRGVPCIRGLRIPVATVIGQLAAGRSAAEVLAEFPDLESEDITAALEYAAAAGARA
jgi:uncharacterized protein (DUF433 family)